MIQVSDLNNERGIQLIILFFNLVPTCAFTTLTVNVEDVNDNKPVFSSLSYEFGKYILQVSNFNSFIPCYN